MSTAIQLRAIGYALANFRLFVGNGLVSEDEVRIAAKRAFQAIGLQHTDKDMNALMAYLYHCRMQRLVESEDIRPFLDHISKAPTLMQLLNDKEAGQLKKTVTC
jgi:hypothetical protein